jgi:hypothetical protein
MGSHSTAWLSPEHPRRHITPVPPSDDDNGVDALTDHARASPFGVPWSQRTSTGWNVRSAQDPSHGLEHRRPVLACHVELLGHLVDAEVLEVLDERGPRQARTGP